ncbi:cell wall protein [Nocardioides sp. NBC_00368]|uniref:cell wall protein n=1 Tax=Nocardioides sp. NBC_00368 TaxID=2976000 RepID=UPI002E1C0BD1
MSAKRNKNRKSHANRPRRVPPVLPRLKIRVFDDDDLVVTLDGTPYRLPEHWTELGRDAVPRLVDLVAVEHGPVHVQVTEADGKVYTDIATPPDFASAIPVASNPRGKNDGMSEFVEGGYVPGEWVDVAVIVHAVQADSQGYASLNMPPALLQSVRGDIVLLGRGSGTYNLIEPR